MNIRPLYPDKELLQKLQDGDTTAFDCIYDRYGQQLLFKLKRLIKLQTAIEEIHQDIFIRFWNTRSSLTPDTNLQAYLYTIARNLTIDFYRKAARDRELQKQLAFHIESACDHIEPLLAYKETTQVLEQLIALLPPKRQNIFRMVKIDGKSYPEVAEFYGISLNTVKDHMKKSSSFIKTQMGKEFPNLILTTITYIILK